MFCRNGFTGSGLRTREMIPQVGNSKSSGKSSAENTVPKQKCKIALLVCSVGIIQMVISAGIATGWAISDHGAECQDISCGRKIQYAAMVHEFLVGLALLLTAIVRKSLVQEFGMYLWVWHQAIFLGLGTLVYWLPIENPLLYHFFCASANLFFVVSVTRFVGISVVLFHFLERIFEEEEGDDDATKDSGSN